jgi:phage/plasmid-associated DNA primase
VRSKFLFIILEKTEFTKTQQTRMQTRQIPRLPLTHVKRAKGSFIMDDMYTMMRIPRKVLGKIVNYPKLLNVLHNPAAAQTFGLYAAPEKQQMMAMGLCYEDDDSDYLVEQHKRADFGWGRFVPMGGLSMMSTRRNLRQCLQKDPVTFEQNVTDLDMENAHPTLLHNVCEDNDIPNPCLTCYITQREPLLKRTMALFDCGRESAKRLYLRLTFLGGMNNWRKDNKIVFEEDEGSIRRLSDDDQYTYNYIKAFQSEMRTVADIIWNQNQLMRDEILVAEEEQDPDKNPKSTIMSFYLQEWENLVMDVALRELIKRGRLKKVRGRWVMNFMADGCSLPDTLTTADLERLQEEVLYQTGQRIVFTCKQFEDAITDLNELVPDSDVFDFVDYRKWENKRKRMASEMLGNMTNDALGRYLEHLYRPQFVCADPHKNEWYHYDGSRWDCEGASSTLYDFIKYEVAPCHILPLVKEHTKVLKAAEDALNAITDVKSAAYVQQKAARDKIAKLHTIYTRSYAQLESTNFKRDSIHSLGCTLHNPRFDTTLDQDRKLLAFKNGLYDFTTNTFRRGQPSDLVSLSTNVDYPDVASMDAEAKELFDRYTDEFHQFFRQVFIREDVRNNMLDYWASMVVGGNESRTLAIHIGPGANAKSKVTTLLSLLMGDYFKQMTNAFFCGKPQQSEGASPNLLRCNGVRMVAINEAGGTEQVWNACIVKEYTGEECNVSGRSLYSNKYKEFKLQMKMFVNCNNFPKFTKDASDDAFWDRMKAIPFESRFLDATNRHKSGYDPENRFHFPMDEQIEAKMVNWIGPMWYFLINRYNETKGKVKWCDYINETTAMYRTRDDSIADFIEKKLVKDVNGSITRGVLANEVRLWFQTHHNNKTMDPQLVFSRLADRYIEGEGGFEGIRLKQEGEASRTILPPKMVFKAAFLSTFKQTDKATDCVSTSEIQQWAIDNKMPITKPIQIRETLAEIGIVRDDKKLRINGAVCRGYTRLRFLGDGEKPWYEEADEDEEEYEYNMFDEKRSRLI